MIQIGWLQQKAENHDQKTFRQNYKNMSLQFIAQELATDRCLEPDKSSLHHPTLFL